MGNALEHTASSAVAIHQALAGERSAIVMEGS
jgi:hypothetical protein